MGVTDLNYPKFDYVIVPTATASNATSTGTIDTLGFDYCCIDVILGTAAATTTPIALKVEEGDTTSSYSAITALTGGTAANTSGYFVLAARPETTDEVYARLNIDLRGRKRHLKVSVTPGTTANAQVIAALYRADEMETTVSTTAHGCSVIVNE